jgi:hypothetical protein
VDSVTRPVLSIRCTGSELEHQLARAVVELLHKEAHDYVEFYVNEANREPAPYALTEKALEEL